MQRAIKSTCPRYIRAGKINPPANENAWRRMKEYRTEKNTGRGDGGGATKTKTEMSTGCEGLEITLSTSQLLP